MSSNTIVLRGDLQEPLMKEDNDRNQKQQDPLKSLVTVVVSPPQSVASSSSSGMALNRVTSTCATTARERSETEIERKDGSTIDDLRTYLAVDQQFTINTGTSYTSNLPMPYDPCCDSVICQDDRNRTKHEEAALYVREGEDDSKFFHHPRSKWSRRAYEILHHPVYCTLHLLVCVLLLLLAFAETPTVGEGRLIHESDKEVLVSVHSSLEILLLNLLTLDFILRWVWLRTRYFVTHRTIVLSVVLAVMYVEALTVLIRKENHFRITRLFRPIFIIDTNYMVGVRRVIRQIVEILKPILDVLILIFFLIAVFSLCGYLIFAQKDPTYFSSIGQGFLSLFITMTSANNPDVMMESFAQQDGTPLFFILYIIITFYFASNVLLAVVYSSFSEADKKKFKKIILHKRDALHRAFHILSSDPHVQSQHVQFHDFLLFMKHYQPLMSEWQVMCVFKALNKNPQRQYQGLNLEDFLRFYEVIDYRWEEVDEVGSKVAWFYHLNSRLHRPIRVLSIIVNHRVYKFLMGIVVFINLIFLIIYASHVHDNSQRFDKFQSILPITLTFITIYATDIVVNIIGHGPYNYFKKFWNIADVAVILLSFVCALLTYRYQILAIIQPVKLVRLVRLKGRYRDLMNTMVDITPRVLNVFILILVIYYSFAIVGMEFFSHKLHQGCCNTSFYGVEQYYSDSTTMDDNNTISSNVYYLNNFDNILRSYVTLFILMVVNNWYIIMEGHASEVDVQFHWLTRIYFMTFYIITLVVLQVILSFIVEAFVIKIQATERRRVCERHPRDNDCNCQQENKKTVMIILVEEDLAKLKYEMTYLDESERDIKFSLWKVLKKWKRKRFNIIHNKKVKVIFVGQRPHTKEDVHLLHYKDEMKGWMVAHKLSLAPKKKPKRNIKVFLRKACMHIVDFIID